VDVSGSSLFLLDTNTAGYIIRGESPSARDRLRQSLATPGRVAISSITEAEIRYGLELKPGAGRLRAAVEQLLTRIAVRAWDSAAAHAYGRLRAQLKAAGKPLAELDLMIAAHALALQATLVSHDRAFRHVAAFVTVVDWATDL
jgi:tRNA(fMet)-specific endonuclease VapC